MKAVVENTRKYYKYTTTPNAAIVGSPTVSNGVMSGFSTSNYAQIYVPSVSLVGINTFEVQFKVKTGSSSNNYMKIMNPQTVDNAYSNFAVQIAGTSSDKTVTLLFRDGSNSFFGYQALTSYSNNTDYWFRWIYDGNKINSYYSLDGENFILNQSQDKDSRFITALSKYNNFTTVTVGATSDAANTFTGSIDFKQSYIKVNNREIWHGTTVEESTSSDYDYYKDVSIYKTVKEIVRKYYKYDWEEAVSPIFYSQTEATEGIDGVKIINNAGYYYLTQRTTHTISKGNIVTFDMGETSKGITSIGFTGIVSGGNYPSLVMSNVQCSEDNSTWTTITSSYGSRSSVYTNPLVITTPNNYRYIRFTASNDDSGYSQGGCQSLTVGYNKRIVINGTPDDYDFYKDVDVYKAIKSYTKGQYYGN